MKKEHTLLAESCRLACAVNDAAPEERTAEGGFTCASAPRMKRIFSGLMLLMSVFALICLSGCTATTAEYDQDYADEAVTSYVEWMLSMDEETLEGMLEYPTSALDEDELIQYEGLQTYYNILDEIGAYAGSYGDYTYKNSSDEVIVNVTAEGTKRTFTIELIFDVDQGYFFLTSISCTADYSLGEKLVAAAQNTVIGVVIVFIVLILILIILSQLHRIDMAIDAVTGWFTKRKAAKAAKQSGQQTGNAPAPSGVTAPAGQPAAATPASAEDYIDDTELVAVIAAAIAASEGTAPDGFVVRSIRRSDKWKRGK
ncbi:MAG: OadG family protein [Lachnospiraceae bacterium]|nr:OadG family protein [Lachnospiraceae bacterium]